MFIATYYCLNFSAILLQLAINNQTIATLLKKEANAYDDFSLQPKSPKVDDGRSWQLDP